MNANPEDRERVLENEGKLTVRCRMLNVLSRRFFIGVNSCSFAVQLYGSGSDEEPVEDVNEKQGG